jgi:steroid delta-isomerase-like uncharacterized protein
MDIGISLGVVRGASSSIAKKCAVTARTSASRASGVARLRGRAELIAPDAIFHVPGQPEALRGPGGYLALVGMLRGGFPDLQWTLEDVVAEEEHVAARYTMRGTHRGAFFGVPPTGRPITVQSMAFYRIAGGQFVEEHGLPDMLGLMRQIGAVPAT